MNTKHELPLDLTPLNIRAYLCKAFNICGCAEDDEVIITLKRLLEWYERVDSRSVSYAQLYTEPGVFYILSGLLDSLDLAEHGVSARVPWLTIDGQRLLVALREHSAHDITHATGQAYDGLEYPF